MLYIFMGPSCSGKSSTAAELKKLTDVQIYSGKDYLRMDKNENNAWETFEEKLKEACNNKDLNSKSIIYVVSEKKDIVKLKFIDEAITINFTADAEIIKSRFAKRMNGILPKPIENMIEKQLIEWKDTIAKLHVDTSADNANDIAKKVYDMASIGKSI
jgi:adenylate kinase family enzyme